MTKQLYVAQYRLYNINYAPKMDSVLVEDLNITFKEANIYQLEFRTFLDAELYFGTVMMYGQLASDNDNILYRGYNGYDYWSRMQAKALLPGITADTWKNFALYLPSIRLYEDVTDRIWGDKRKS